MQSSTAILTIGVVLIALSCSVLAKKHSKYGCAESITYQTLAYTDSITGTKLFKSVEAVDVLDCAGKALMNSADIATFEPGKSCELYKSDDSDRMALLCSLQEFETDEEKPPVPLGKVLISCIRCPV